MSYRCLSLFCMAALVCCGASSTCLTSTGGLPGGNTNGTDCTEDASIYAMVVVEPDSVMTRASVCTNIQPELETRLAKFHIVNTHPTRKIAVSFILTQQSDHQYFPPGPCTYSVQQGAFSSLDECHQGLAMGCSSPLGLFIEPGKSSATWTFECKREELYPSSGACGDRELETITWHILGHAVFCDDYNAAQANFCAVADPRLFDDGLPVNNNWVAIQSSECP